MVRVLGVEKARARKEHGETRRLVGTYLSNCSRPSCCTMRDNKNGQERKKKHQFICSAILYPILS